MLKCVVEKWSRTQVAEVFDYLKEFNFASVVVRLLLAMISGATFYECVIPAIVIIIFSMEVLQPPAHCHGNIEVTGSPSEEAFEASEAPYENKGERVT
ncbi:MAG: hypothetical protein J6T40_05125 [Clostridiales bacterium]|nr:hypothetical protein [Clostridiales bacterium]